MKIQPIDSSQTFQEKIRIDSTKQQQPPVSKYRFKRLFDRQFPTVVRGQQYGRSAGESGSVSEFEPSSVCLAKMVQNFIEENHEKQSVAKCGRNRCNCFNGNRNDESDDEFDDVFGDSFTYSDSSDTLKSLIGCASVVERKLLADTMKIVEKNKVWKGKDDLRKIVSDGLLTLGYDASICRSRWEKSASCPAGEYDYVDVIIEQDRILIDVDFRSEFDIARSTGTYKSILQSLPYIFIGKCDRLHQIISIVSESAKQSLKNKSMHIAPWRKTEYVRNKWLGPYTRMTCQPLLVKNDVVKIEGGIEEFELVFGEDTTSFGSDIEVVTWQPPAVKPKRKVVVTGLASLLKEKA